MRWTRQLGNLAWTGNIQRTQHTWPNSLILGSVKREWEYFWTSVIIWRNHQTVAEWWHAAAKISVGSSFVGLFLILSAVCLFFLGFVHVTLLLLY